MSARAVIYESFGNPWEKLQLKRIPIHTSRDSIKVRFLASPVNPSDLNQIEGTYPVKPYEFPAVAGNEGVARIECINEGNSGLKVGDLVIPARSGLGCWRDFAELKAEDVQKIPDEFKSLPLEVLSTLKVNPPTAYRLLRDFVPLNRGDFIVQNGANSAVGRLVIQMATLLGFNTINIIRNRPDFDTLAHELQGLARGTGSVIVIKAEEVKDLKGKLPGAKLGLNCVGGGAAGEMTGLMCDADSSGSSGIIVTYGAMGRRPLSIPASSLIFKNLSFRGFWLTSWYKNHPVESLARTEMFLDILKAYRDGLLTSSKHFYMNINEEERLNEFIKSYMNGDGSDLKDQGKGKCIIKFE